MDMRRSNKGLILCIVGLLTCVLSCSDDEMTDNEYVNQWIQTQMKGAYLWNDGMPSPRKSLDPKAYFAALKSSQDRFSWIENNYEELLNSLKGVNKEAGYEYKLYGNQTNNNVDMQIMYIKAGSLIETENVDLLRGDIITEINGKRITRSNYEEILEKEIPQTHTITYKRFNPETDTWEDKGQATLHTAQFAENPNFLNTVITVGGRKIGYYVYNFFAAGPTQGSTVYDDQMATVFAGFKAAGITDLVIDLRFNSGGSISSATALASYIGKDVDANDVFTQFQYNAELQAYAIQKYGADYLKLKFITTPNNVGTQINNRVYFLTSKRTASASELVINGLKPYMSQITLVGDSTVGKNVGSTSIYKENDPRNTWGMQPIIVKLYNSQNQADYDEGFVPDVLDVDNEREIYPLGDVNEKLLSKAIDRITGGTVARKARTGKTTQGYEVATSADFKESGYTLMMNDELTKECIKGAATRIPGSF